LSFVSPSALNAAVNNTNLSGKYTDAFFGVDTYRLLKCFDERSVYKMLEPKDIKPSVVSKTKIIKNQQKGTKKNIEPTKDRDDAWGIKTNELNNLIRSKNVFIYTKAQSLNSFSHVHLMTKERIVKKLCEWKLLSKD